jgi:hypothetical protein
MRSSIACWIKLRSQQVTWIFTSLKIRRTKLVAKAFLASRVIPKTKYQRLSSLQREDERKKKQNIRHKNNNKQTNNRYKTKRTNRNETKTKQTKKTKTNSSILHIIKVNIHTNPWLETRTYQNVDSSRKERKERKGKEENAYLNLCFRMFCVFLYADNCSKRLESIQIISWTQRFV